MEIYSSKLKAIKLSLMSIFMVACSLFSIILGLDKKNIFLMPLLIFTGIIGTLFFGMTTLFYLKNIFFRTPILTLTQDGFYDSSSVLSMKNRLISWDIVYRIEYRSLMNQGMVAIFLKDKDFYLEGVSSLKRRLTKININMGYGEITINMSQIKDISGPELATIMNEYLSNYNYNS